MMFRISIVVVALTFVPGLANAAGPLTPPLPPGGLGSVNPNTQVIDPSTGRPTPPFTNKPNPLNNPYPVDPWFWQQPEVLQRVWIPDQQIAIEVYVPAPGSLSGSFQSQVVTLPGYLVTETTTGLFTEGHWTIVAQTRGVNRWQWVPPVFTPKPR
jgi:hypothetical protein